MTDAAKAVTAEAGEVPGPILVGPLDISDENWREYEWMDHVYRINSPYALYYRIGGTTHRVVDTGGVTHCLPAPGQMGCVLRWYSPHNPVSF